mmetsp:Transcript_35795/g.106287  ORF Transcript_35795/g.106287 Transcript_35795/m.106287 type:complete len:305 (-) Transcript_35795:1501-2415(-)
MASTLLPGIIALMAVLSLAPSLAARFCTIVSPPASPKPRASREPSLMIVFSRMLVSSVVIGPLLALPLPFFLASCAFSFLLWRRCRALSSPSAAAIIGFVRIMSTSLVIRSMGARTSLSTSRAKSRAPAERTRMMKKVCVMPKTASHFDDWLTSKMKTKCPSTCWSKKLLFRIDGVYQIVSCRRNFLLGQGTPGTSETPWMMEPASSHLTLQGLPRSSRSSSEAPPRMCSMASVATGQKPRGTPALCRLSVELTARRSTTCRCPLLRRSAPPPPPPTAPAGRWMKPSQQSLALRLWSRRPWLQT